MKTNNPSIVSQRYILIPTPSKKRRPSKLQHGARSQLCAGISTTPCGFDLSAYHIKKHLQTSLTTNGPTSSTLNLSFFKYSAFEPKCRQSYRFSSIGVTNYAIHHDDCSSRRRQHRSRNWSWSFETPSSSYRGRFTPSVGEGTGSCCMYCRTSNLSSN